MEPSSSSSLLYLFGTRGRSLPDILACRLANGSKHIGNWKAPAPPGKTWLSMAAPTMFRKSVGWALHHERNRASPKKWGPKWIVFFPLKCLRGVSQVETPLDVHPNLDENLPNPGMLARYLVGIAESVLGCWNFPILKNVFSGHWLASPREWIVFHSSKPW